MADVIPFDAWIRRVFDHAVIDYDWWWREETEWNELPPSTSLDYLSRLFEESGQLLRSYSDAQVDQGLWLVVGHKYDHISALIDPSISWPKRLRCVRSIQRLFETFADRCSPHLSHLDETGSSPLNSICYMFFDLMRIRWQADSPDAARLDAALLGVMAEILKSPSEACQEGALHGLGHRQHAHSKAVEQIVAHYLTENPSLRFELRMYAEKAQTGAVL